MLISEFKKRKKAKPYTKIVNGKKVLVDGNPNNNKSNAEKFKNYTKDNKLSRAIRDWEYLTRGVRHLGKTGSDISDTIRRNKHLVWQMQKQAKSSESKMKNIKEVANTVNSVKRAIGI